MDTYISRDISCMSKGKGLRIQALADSGSSASIISLDLAEQLKLEVEEPGGVRLEDASGAAMDVTALARV